MTADEIIQYIGLPWIAGERDCWAFFRELQARHYGLFVPAVDIDALDLRCVVSAFDGHDEKRNWTEIELPEDGCAVLMQRNRYPSHIGMWVNVDGGKVLHCAQGIGVVCQNLQALKFEGWTRISYWRHR